MSDCEHDIDIDTSMTRLRCVKCGLDANVIEIKSLQSQIKKAEEVIGFYTELENWMIKIGSTCAKCPHCDWINNTDKIRCEGCGGRM